MDQDRLEGTARTLGGKAESLAGNLTGDEKLKADGLVDKVTGKAQRVVGNAKDSVRGATDNVRDVAGDYGSGLLDTVEEYGDILAEKIDERPITSLLIAAGVGLLLAFATKPTPQVAYRRR